MWASLLFVAKYVVVAKERPRLFNPAAGPNSLALICGSVVSPTNCIAFFSAQQGLLKSQWLLADRLSKGC